MLKALQLALSRFNSPTTAGAIRAAASIMARFIDDSLVQLSVAQISCTMAGVSKASRISVPNPW